MKPELIDVIDALLPQTQCTKCGYQGCRPYAEALAHGDADINQCPPGGAAGIRKLARLLGRPEKPLNPSNGSETARAAALIDESRCIGCMLCIEACPVDAIVGTAKRMHTVLTESCTGCELCLPPCPVDCIDMIDLDTLAQRGNRHAVLLAAQSVEDMAANARERFGFHEFRLARAIEERDQRLSEKALDKRLHLEPPPGSHDPDRKKAAVQAAIERARARRAG
ncbi:MAG: electron transport complex subunit RsxB [Betaproteobacteria bacterium]|nr:electron transport complex subunit RsxB [Betaproteobacteria bacterium]